MSYNWTYLVSFRSEIHSLASHFGIAKVMDVCEQKTIYLWGLPRSLSTAVLRAMVSVDGCLVSGEVTLQLPGESQPIQEKVSANPQSDIYQALFAFAFESYRQIGNSAVYNFL